MRTARVKKIGPETLDSLAQANLALARLAGCDWIETHFADGLGPLPQGLPGLLKMPFFLENPKTGLPIDAGNLFMVSLGLLVLEGIGAQSLSQRDSKELSELLSEYVRQWCSIKDIPPLMVIPQLVMKYPVKEMHRKEMLLRVLLDLDVYYPSELLEEVGPLMVFIEMLGDVPGATGREKLIKALSELKCDSD
ncbi:hypothetical protein VB716_05170 [Synechococcus sp. CCY9201]|uniref:hypothetical protein n=1 Tax=unclassified Synechococcus TaxID=2626047 RepID=UPI002AD2F979|nr:MULTISPECIES: hypothetical protein [unclassified Synechococcus]MEA5473609.1 hypothetical protein [Synechococcus sp. CCY9201]